MSKAIIWGIYYAQGKFDNALMLYQKVLAIRETLVEKLETPDAYKGLCTVHHNIGLLWGKQNNFALSFDHITISREICEKHLEHLPQYKAYVSKINEGLKWIKSKMQEC